MTVTSTTEVVNHDRVLKNLQNRLDDLGEPVNQTLVIDDLTRLDLLDKKQYLVMGNAQMIPQYVGYVDTVEGLVSNTPVGVLQANLAQALPQFLTDRLNLMA